MYSHCPPKNRGRDTVPGVPQFISQVARRECTTAPGQMPGCKLLDGRLARRLHDEDRLARKIPLAGRGVDQLGHGLRSGAYPPCARAEAITVHDFVSPRKVGK